MTNLDRRRFESMGSLGVGLAASAFTLATGAQPTEESGALGEQSPVLLQIKPAEMPKTFQPTEDNILGPYHRKSAPFRAKVTPPLEPGETLVVRGGVWAHDTRKPLAG